MKKVFLLVAVTVCLASVCRGNQTGTLVVSPGSDAVWTCVLAPFETATLQITVEPPPPGYRLESKTVEITGSNPEVFIWRGEYSVVNSSGVAATTKVKVNCVWSPVGGRGSGGGRRRPDLTGSATGIATAEPGQYWNEADSDVLPVGGHVEVRAWKNDKEPAPSSWSVSGPAILSGGGVSVTVTGIDPGQGGVNDVVVTSVCDASGKSDSAYLTVVSDNNQSSLKVWITSPRDGRTVSGNAVLLMGHAAPANRVKSAQFQLKPSTSDVWLDFGSAFTPTPKAYSLYLNASDLESGGQYNLRLLAEDTDGAVAISDVITFTVE